MRKYKRRKNSIKFLSLLLVMIVSLFSLYNKDVDDIKDDSTNKTRNVIQNSELLTVHFIDVGQGDSAFVELPNKEAMLIDAGERDKGQIVIDYINNLGYKKIDYLVGTHPHTDHIGGLENVIDNFKIGNIYMPKKISTSNTFISLLEKIDEKKMTITTAKKGLEIYKDNSLSINVLSPSKEYKDTNDNSVVIKMTYNKACFMFMADASGEIEDTLNGVKCDVIKVGHHGSNTSSTTGFVNKTSAKYAIISVGKDNSYNHPSDKIVKRWQNINALVMRTDINGNIIIKTDGNSYIIEKEK